MSLEKSPKLTLPTGWNAFILGMKYVITVLIWFLLMKPYPMISHTHTSSHSCIPIQWDNPYQTILLFPSATGLHVPPPSFCFRIISVPLGGWSFQLPLFQFRLPEASGNNETVGHGKIISLHSIHIVVLLTHDPGLSPPSVYLTFDVLTHLESICHFLTTISPRHLSLCQNQPVGLKGKASSFFRGKAGPCLWLANTEQHWVVCLAGTDAEQTEAFQTSGWPWTSVISPSGAAGSANSQRIVLAQLPCLIQSNFTLIILNLVLAFLPCSGEWDFV